MRVELLLPALTEAKSPLLPARSSTRSSRPSASRRSPATSTRTTRSASRTSTSRTSTSTATPDLVGIEVYVTSARRAYAIADRYRGAGRARRPRRPARDRAPRRGRAPRRHDRPRPGGGGVAPLPRRLPRRPAAAASTARARGRSPGCRPCAATWSGASSTSCPTRSSSRGAALTPAPSATRTASSRAARSFYVQAVDAALAEIERLPGRHLYFLDDHLFGDPALRRGALRRDAGDGAAVAGGRHGRLGPAAGAPGEGRGVRPAEPLRRLRDARARRASARRASARTSGATTRPPSGGSTTSA